MKKIVYFFMILSFFSKLILSNDNDRHLPYTVAFSSGYVFKNDCKFKKVYGHGAANIITTDFCYYPWSSWGFGTKVTYLRAKGRTTFLDFCTLLQQVPLTFYARGAHTFNCGVQLYGSLGGGFTWIKEKSYLGCIKAYKGIGEAEVGLHCRLWNSWNFTTAFRYLFPPQSLRRKRSDYSENNILDIGGCDLRAGFSFLF